MPEFGWAYVVGSMVHGPSGSVQTAVNQRLSGSKNLVYHDSSGSLQLTGSLLVSGSITANQYNVNIVNKSVTNLSASGDTKFGDSTDDTHVFTGSILLSSSTKPLKISGLSSGAARSYGHYLALNANNEVVLTASTPPGGGGLIDEYTNAGARRIITSIDSSGINAEANLLFNGSLMSLTGALSASVGISSSIGQFTQLTASEGIRIGNSTVIITPTAISGPTSIIGDNLAGTLSTAAQPSIQTVGTLTDLTVAGDVTVDTNLFKIDSTDNKVGIGLVDPAQKLDIYSTGTQLRLTAQKASLGNPLLCGDFKVDSSGYLIVSASGDRIGIGTSTPKRMLDVEGSMRVAGNLEVTGTLHANVTEFIVSSNTITFGNQATDSLKFNAATGTIPNGFNFGSHLLVLNNEGSKVGIGVQHPDTKLEVLSTNKQLKLSYDAAKFATFEVKSTGDLNIQPSHTAITSSGDLFVSGNAVFGRTCNDIITTIGQFTASCGLSASTYVGADIRTNTGVFTTSLQVGNDTVVITPTTISGATTITSDYYVGTLNTAAQPNITSVGTLTSLAVSGELSASNTLYSSNLSQRVGVGRTDPQRKFEVLSTTPQMRLSYQRQVGMAGSNIYSDIYTNASGYQILTASGGRLGVGTTSPTQTLDVNGNARIGGNLYVTGALHAKVSEFKVSANNIEFGDSSTDTLIFNASTGTVMNGLNWDNDTWVMDSDQNRIGIGVAHPQSKLHVSSSTLTLLQLNGSKFSVAGNGNLNINPSGPYLTASSGFKVSGSTYLGSLSTQHTVVSGELSASVAVSSSLGRFTSLTSSIITDGIVTMTTGTIQANAVNANNLGGTLTTPTQGAITSVGTLTSLVVGGEVTASTVFYSSDVSKRVGIGRNDPQRKFEVLSTTPQMRLSYERQVGLAGSNIYSDTYTNASGYLILTSSGGRIGLGTTTPSVMLEIAGDTKINGALAITGLSAGTGVTTKYLALDGSNNVVLTSSTDAGIETRNRRVVTGNTTLAVDDYYLGISASTNVTITLLNASALNNGQTFTIKDEGGSASSHIFTVQAVGGQKIDSGTSVILESSYGALNLYTNGSDKYFIF